MTTIECQEVTTLKEYFELAKERGLLSRDGDYLILKRVFGQRMMRNICVGLTISDVNRHPPEFFTSEEAAQNYCDICRQWEPDLPYNGAIIVKRVKNFSWRKSVI